MHSIPIGHSQVYTVIKYKQECIYSALKTFLSTNKTNYYGYIRRNH